MLWSIQDKHNLCCQRVARALGNLAQSMIWERAVRYSTQGRVTQPRTINFMTGLQLGLGYKALVFALTMNLESVTLLRQYLTNSHPDRITTT